MTVFVHSIVIICFKFLFVDRLGPPATSSHSIRLRCNTVHKQTSSPTTNAKRLYELFLSFLHSFGISGKWCVEDYSVSAGPKIRRVLFLDTLSSTETRNHE